MYLLKLPLTRMMTLVRCKRRQGETTRNEKTMSIESPNSDADLLDLLRITGPLRVTEMAHAMEVTPTAIRQRLVRLMAQGIIDREAVRMGRGRPRHNYRLTEKGVRMTGSNFSDLAMTLWREVSTVSNGEVRRDVLRRIAKALAAGYAGEIEGQTPVERMHSLCELLARRRIPASVHESEASPQMAVLATHACPYPNLAEEDQGVCAMEKMLFSELLGSEVRLVQCRLAGEGECRFQIE
jgi:DeoR family transcriptional regulator, suf operon transcriptional repressor